MHRPYPPNFLLVVSLDFGYGLSGMKASRSPLRHAVSYSVITDCNIDNCRLLMPPCQLCWHVYVRLNHSS